MGEGSQKGPIGTPKLLELGLRDQAVLSLNPVAPLGNLEVVLSALVLISSHIEAGRAYANLSSATDGDVVGTTFCYISDF